MLIFADENIKSFTMEEQKTTDLTTEELSKAQRTIAVVLAEIQEEGHSKIMPFDIGGVEIRMLRYAAIFITATKIKDPAEFTLPKYMKI